MLSSGKINNGYGYGISITTPSILNTDTGFYFIYNIDQPQIQHISLFSLLGVRTHVVIVRDGRVLSRPPTQPIFRME